jgi:hypothetical protein
MAQGTLGELIKALRETYCRGIGVEYMHIEDTRVRRWLQQRMEPSRNQPRFARERKLRILRDLHAAELFEKFLHTSYVGQKRFSLEGAETLDAARGAEPLLCRRHADRAGEPWVAFLITRTGLAVHRVRKAFAYERFLRTH